MNKIFRIHFLYSLASIACGGLLLFYYSVWVKEEYAVVASYFFCLLSIAIFLYGICSAVYHCWSYFVYCQMRTKMKKIVGKVQVRYLQYHSRLSRKCYFQFCSNEEMFFLLDCLAKEEEKRIKNLRQQIFQELTRNFRYKM